MHAPGQERHHKETQKQAALLFRSVAGAKGAMRFRISVIHVGVGVTLGLEPREAVLTWKVAEVLSDSTRAVVRCHVEVAAVLHSCVEAANRAGFPSHCTSASAAVPGDSQEGLARAAS
jgi:hypothetical protein